MMLDLKKDTAATSQQIQHGVDDFKHTTVLIIDDDPVYRVLLRDLCRKLGIGHITEATDGTQGLDCVHIVKPDLILLDILMPGLDGLEVCRRLRKIPVTAETAILIQTGVTDEARRLGGFQAGASDVVSKPLNLPEFMARTRTHLRNALYLRQLSAFRSRIEGHLDIANGFMDALLPGIATARELAQRNGFSLSLARKKSEEISGDLWSLHEIKPGRLLLILLDTNTAGLAGAINAMRVDSVLRELWRHIGDPQQLLRKLDEVMAQSPCGQLFASITAVVVDRSEGALWYTASGNPYPIFCHDGNAAALICGGLPLGSGMAALDLNYLPMDAGDTVLLHTDGWPTSPQENPLDMIDAALRRDQPLTAENLFNPQDKTRDDVTLLTLQRMR